MKKKTGKDDVYRLLKFKKKMYSAYAFAWTKIEKVQKYVFVKEVIKLIRLENER